ncbi:MAG TPA: hypothetical protein VFB21_19165 [Chthonomonadaceae bacterium]|nr:hypothetical protein [Chthonomonadaceae bacterium]
METINAESAQQRWNSLPAELLESSANWEAVAAQFKALFVEEGDSCAMEAATKMGRLSLHCHDNGDGAISRRLYP